MSYEWSRLQRLFFCTADCVGLNSLYRSASGEQGTDSFVTYVVCGMALPALISVVGFQIMQKMKLVRDAFDGSLSFN